MRTSMMAETPTTRFSCFHGSRLSTGMRMRICQTREKLVSIAAPDRDLRAEGGRGSGGGVRAAEPSGAQWFQEPIDGGRADAEQVSAEGRREVEGPMALQHRHEVGEKGARRWSTGSRWPPRPPEARGRHPPRSAAGDPAGGR